MNLQSDVDRLLLDVTQGMRQLVAAELTDLLNQVSRVGFHPTETERVRGRLSSLVWQGRTLKGSDRLPSASVHYLWHVVLRREWPDRTTQAEYIASIRRIITDPVSGVFTNKFQDAPGLGIIRESGDLRDLRELNEPEWSDIRWLRRPASGSGH